MAKKTAKKTSKKTSPKKAPEPTPEVVEEKKPVDEYDFSDEVEPIAKVEA